jgi:hypothetical protein
MTNLYDFLFNKSPKDIKNLVKSLEIKNSLEIKRDVKEFLNQLDLEDDPRVLYQSIRRRYSTTSFRFSIEIPLSQTAKTYLLRGSLNFSGSSCSVSLGPSEGSTTLISEYLGLFDARKEYNNLEVNVNFPNLAPELLGDDLNLKRDCTFSQIDREIQKYYTKISPKIQDYLEKCNDGTIESLWNTYNPRNPLNVGDAIFVGYCLGSELYLKYTEKIPGFNIEDLVILGTNLNGAGRKDSDIKKLIDPNTPGQEVPRIWSKVKSEFLKKIRPTSNHSKWINSLVDSNLEFKQEIDKIRNEVARKYNINPRYLDCLRPPRIEQFKDVPEDGYYSS